MRWSVCLLVASGCAANFADSLEPDAAGDVDRKLGAAHGIEGEHVEYEMKLAGMVVGRFQVAVGNRGVVDGRPSVIVRSKASLAGAGTILGNIDWELTTTVDIDTGFAIEQEETVSVDAVIKEGKNQSKKKWSVDERHHNAHSAAGALRGWFSAPGATDSLQIGLFDNHVPVSISDAAREMIDGKPAARYDGLLRNKHAFSVWVSDDAARVPLRLRSGSKIGEIEVALVDYSSPAED
jgi:hypothetical protein